MFLCDPAATLVTILFLFVFRGDHGLVPSVRTAGGGLAAQGRVQELLPAQGIRLPAIPGMWECPHGGRAGAGAEQ